MNDCPFGCGYAISTTAHLVTHTINCALRTVELDRVSAKRLILQRKFGVSAEQLVHDYKVLQLSLPDIKNKYGINYAAVTFLLGCCGQQTRTIKQSCKKRQQKSETTCLAKYGTKNVSSLPVIKQKKSDTFMLHFGVTNVRKSRDYYNHVDAVCLERYGSKRVSNGPKVSAVRKSFSATKKKHLLDQYKASMRAKYGVEYGFQLAWGPGNSKIEQRIHRILADSAMGFQTQVPLGRYIFDVLVPTYRCIIEVNGDFWHANPRFYKDEDILKHPGGNKIAKDIWIKDILKKQTVESYGFRCIVLWECDINKMSDEQLTETILNEIGQDQKNHEN